MLNLNDFKVDKLELKIKNGYILLAPKYFESQKNWHLFKVEAIDELDEELKFLERITKYDYIEEESEEYINIGEDKINIKDLDLAECKEKIKDRNLKDKNFEAITITYNLQKMERKYIEENIEEQDNLGLKGYSFKGKGNYYTNKDRDFFYSKEPDIIRILACMLRKSVCGVCMSTLYGDNKKEEENDLEILI